MAVRLLAYEVADLCLGKPPLRSLSIYATVADALSALKSSFDTCLSVWTCDYSKSATEECRCIGKVCMVDVICYLCKDENLSSLSSALKSPVSVLLSKLPGLVRHVEPSSSIEDALHLFSAPETVEGYRTSVAKAEVVNASKTVKILELSEIMILHLMRFNYGGEGCTKLHKLVSFPLELVLGRELLFSPSSEGRRS